MPRARNIKHSFFTNDSLADNDPLGRLLFIGLWTLADYKGDLLWNPRRIKVELLPYDNCDIEKLAINLDKSGFIRFYSDSDRTYINIVNFDRHQNPHRNEKEKGSEIPEYTDDMRQLIDIKGIAINRDKSRQEPESSHSNPADSLSLNPDSGLLNDDVPAGKPPKVSDNKSGRNIKNYDFSRWPSPPSDNVLDDYKKTRKARLTQTAIDRMASEIHKAVNAGLTPDDCLSVCCEAGWQGFKYDWYLNREKKNGNSGQNSEGLTGAAKRASDFHDDLKRYAEGGAAAVLDRKDIR